MDYLIYIITTIPILLYKSNLFTDTTYRIIVVSVIILFIAILYKIKQYQYKYYSKFTRENCIKAKHLMSEYLDLYYVKEKYYTIAMVVTYIILNFIIFLVIRIYLHNKKTESTISFPIDIDILQQVNVKNLEYNTFFTPMMNLILFIITIILYKIIIDKLFITEVYKLHLFLECTRKYSKIKHYLSATYYTRDFLEKSYLFFYNVSLLRIYSISGEEEYFDFSAQNNMYENNKILELSKWCVTMAKKIRLFHFLMRIMLKICRIIYYRVIIYKLTSYFPYIFYFVFILYDITQAEVYYSYYMFFVFYLFLIIIKYKVFLRRVSNVFSDLPIAQYFYKNSLGYEQQKDLLLNSIKNGLHSNSISVETRNLFFPLRESRYTEDVVDYVFNDFTTAFFKQGENRDKQGYNRFTRKDFFMLLLTMLFCCLLMKNYSIYINIKDILPSMPLMYVFICLYGMTLFSWLNIYKSEPNNIDYDAHLFKYSKIYHILFVVIYTITFSLMLLTLITSTLFWITDGIIVNWYNIKITYSYTLTGKIEYFFNYLNNLINNNDVPDNMIETIAIFIDELDIKNLIMEETTLLNMREYIFNIFDLYQAEWIKYHAVSNKEIAVSDNVLDILDKIYTLFSLSSITLAIITSLLAKLLLDNLSQDILLDATIKFLENRGATVLRADEYLIDIIEMIKKHPITRISLLWKIIKIKLGW